jgi:hypothetical protein
MVMFFMGGSAFSHPLDQYNVVWDSQSKNSSESMPVGGGDIGLNVWVENGELLLYLSQSGTFDENMTMLKLGRVRAKLSPNPFEAGKPFRQELKLQDGYLQIDGTDTRIKVWVEVFRPVIHIEAEGNEDFHLEASYESWRTADHPLSRSEREQCLSFLRTEPEQIALKTHPDVFAPADDAMLWYHRNNSDDLVFDKEVEQQHLNPIKDQLTNPLKNLTFGGLMRGTNLKYTNQTSGKYLATPFTAWNYKTTEAAKKQGLEILLHVQQADTLEEWKNGLQKLAEEQVDSTELAEKSRMWWNAYWDRSYIAINKEQADPSDLAWQVGRNYQLLRYMFACNAYGKYPTKFNGGHFTVDPQVIPKGPKEGTPDFRRWGGGSFTAQNQRLVYWPMLKSGDFDMMKPQFQFYLNILNNAEIRTKHYWGHEGASFPEQISFYGLPIGDNYHGIWGKGGLGPRSDEASTRELINSKGETISILDHGYMNNRWVSDQYDNILEFSLMILDYERFTGHDISEYLPLIDSSLIFFNEHYRYWSKITHGTELDENGHLRLYPSSACETYKMTENSATTVAGLKSVLTRLLELDNRYGDAAQRKSWQAFLESVPPLSFRQKNGHKTISPAKSWTNLINQEIPQLYPLFPYRIYGIGKPDLQVAIDTWLYGTDKSKQKSIQCWHQDPIFCALLGRTEEAAEIMKKKIGDAPRRFPTFWGPGPDWVPDLDHGGCAMIGLQEMLMQTSDREIRLLPAWPREWDVSFKLHAPYETTVEAEVKSGKIINLKVTPETRRKDVIFPESFRNTKKE